MNLLIEQISIHPHIKCLRIIQDKVRSPAYSMITQMRNEIDDRIRQVNKSIWHQLYFGLL